MNRGYNSNRVYRCRCKSGVMGWRTRIKNNYSSFKEFLGYCEFFGIHKTFGFKSAEGLWKKNPVVEGSINPSDFRVYKRK